MAKKFDFNTPITAATTVYAKWSYKLHTEPSILTNYTSPNHTDSKRKYVEFGDWPQTIKAEGVYVDETKSKTMGMFTYYLGSDGNHYVKHSDKYYKVEPIVWRVLTEDYKAPDGKSTGNALLLAEKILIGGIRYYVDSSQRTITKETVTGTETETVPVYANNWQYSTIRAWLNGRYEEKDSQDETYTDKGFLQTAFTQSARDKIAPTTVDNTAASTNPASNDKQWNDGKNEYASDTPTTDKVFLLSEAEATTSEYDFDEYNKYVGDKYDTTTSTRIRVTTDYAKTTGAYQLFYGGWWWLRSPYYFLEDHARVIYSDGYTLNKYIVNDTSGGVVPALCIPAKQLLP